jgi:hypothetical protein
MICKLAERFLDKYVTKRRAKTAKDYRSIVDHLIMPALGRSAPPA